MLTWAVVYALVSFMIIGWWNNAILELLGITVSVLIGLLTNQTCANHTYEEIDINVHPSNRDVSANRHPVIGVDNRYSLP